MQTTPRAQSLRSRSPGLHSSGAPNGGVSHPPLPPQGREGFVFVGRSFRSHGLLYLAGASGGVSGTGAGVTGVPTSIVTSSR